MNIADKTTTDAITYVLDCALKFSSGVTVSSATATAKREDTEAVANSLIDAVDVVSGNVLVRFIGGINRLNYKIAVTMTLSNGDQVDEFVLLRVRDK